MENIMDTLITDRTQADVDRARYLNGLWDPRALQWRGTPQEMAEWEAGPRGAYGFADMNRVTQAAAYLIGQLEELGYSVDIEDVTPAYNIRVSVDPASGGTASGAGVFYEGDTATVTAQAGEKYDFVGWMESGQIVSDSTPYSFTVTGPRNLTAAFALKKFQVTASVDPPGSGEVTGAGTYDIDTKVTVAATAGESYVFTRWTEAGETVAESPQYTFNLTKNRTLSSVMTKTYVISVTASDTDGGTVSGGGTYLDGQTVTVAAVAGDGYEFTGWQENGTTVSTEAVYSFQAAADRELMAQFVKTHVITLLVDPAGWGAVQGGGTFREGAQITVTAAPGIGYRFAAWQSGGEQVSTSNPYTFVVTGDQTLTALFEQIPVYSVTATIDPPEAGTVTGAGQYQEGETVTLTAAVNDGYDFTGWQENGVVVSTNNPYTFTAAGDRAFTAVFEEKASRLPAGYIELEYIESTGTQYIDSGVNPSAVGKVQMHIVKLTGTKQYQTFFGSNLTASSSPRYFIMTATYVSTITGGMSNNTQTIATGVSNTDITLELDYINSKFKINDTTVSSAYGKLTSSYQANVYLLAASRKTSNTSTVSTINTASAQLSYCKMYNSSNVLIRDFVPCKNPSGVVGLYDLVGAKFYANAGTGTFTAGPAA